jgi:hypothetical protein
MFALLSHFYEVDRKMADITTFRSIASASLSIRRVEQDLALAAPQITTKSLKATLAGLGRVRPFRGDEHHPRKTKRVQLLLARGGAEYSSVPHLYPNFYDRNFSLLRAPNQTNRPTNFALTCQLLSRTMNRLSEKPLPVKEGCSTQRWNHSVPGERTPSEKETRRNLRLCRMKSF